MRALTLAATFLAFLLSVSGASAHTTLASSTPKGGSTLEQSPAVIEFAFHDAVRITSVVVMGEDKKERRLEFVAGDKPNSFKLPQPKLAIGHNDVQWKGMSKDGHVVSGSLAYTIKPAAAH
ncbi:MAG TPA: copper resistance protein CopC [Steroidobacteraceae bacterium]|nr:copper resistance protein CopC [Steroidobacteraceae bacterium]